MFLVDLVVSDSYVVIHLKRHAVCAKWMARRRAVCNGAPLRVAKSISECEAGLNQIWILSDIRINFLAIEIR